MRSSSSLQREIYNDFTGSTGDVKDLIVKKILAKMIHAKGHNFRILDVGCGDGHILEPFAESNECYGIDVSEMLLARAKKRGIKTYRTDLEVDKFPFASNQFDVVICSEVVEHLIDPDNMLGEINRVLKTSGIFILTIPNVNQPFSFLIQALLDLPPLYSAHYKSPHFRDFTLRITRWLLREFGFDTVQITGTVAYPFENRLSQWLAKLIPRFGEKIIVVSRKTRDPNKELRKMKAIWSQREFLRK